MVDPPTVRAVTPARVQRRVVCKPREVVVDHVTHRDLLGVHVHVSATRVVREHALETRRAPPVVLHTPTSAIDPRHTVRTPPPAPVTQTLRRRALCALAAPPDVTPSAAPVTQTLRRRALCAPRAPLDVTPPASPVTLALCRHAHGAPPAPLDVTPSAASVTLALRRLACRAPRAPLDVTPPATSWYSH